MAFLALWRRSIVAMLAAVVLSGCTTGGGESITKLGDDPVIFVADTEFEYLTGISGTISYYNQTGCLLIDTSSVNGVVWPRSVTPVITADGRRGVKHPEFGEIAEGDSVLLGGVEVNPEEGGDGEHDEQQVYDECGLEYGRSSVTRISEVRDVN